MKKSLLILFLFVFIAPSIALASWWNPFSWKIFNKKEATPQQVQTINTLNNIEVKDNTSKEDIKKLQKDVEDLKKNQIIKNNLNSQTENKVINNTLDSVSKQKELEYQKLVAEKNSTIYVVRKEDTLASIANTFDVKVDDIIKINNLTEESKLTVGEKLLIPSNKFTQILSTKTISDTLTLPCVFTFNSSNTEINYTDAGRPSISFDLNNCDITELEIANAPLAESGYIENIYVGGTNSGEHKYLCVGGFREGIGSTKIEKRDCKDPYATFYNSNKNSIMNWSILANFSTNALTGVPAGTKLGICITSAKTANLAPVEGLPICSSVNTLPARI